MFEVLAASAPRRARSFAASCLSAVAHGAFTALVILVGRSAAPLLGAERTVATPLPLFTGPRAPAGRQAAPPSVHAEAPSIAPAPTSIPSIAPPAIDPVTIPMPSTGVAPATTPGGASGRWAVGVLGTTLPGDPAAPWSADQVDQPTELLGTVTPRYPEAFRRSGIAGTVTLRYVVDSVGRVERGSFQVVEATDSAFALAARDALAGARFRPARAGGRPVRQLVHQRIVFALGGEGPRR